MRIPFIHETNDITNEEIKYQNEQIKHLPGIKITVGYHEVTVYYKLVFTMVGSKVCNAAINISSIMRGYIYKATSKDFNNLLKFNRFFYASIEFYVCLNQTADSRKISRIINT